MKKYKLLAVAGLLMTSSAYAAQSDNDIACERALEGTGLANKIMVELADKGHLDAGDVELFYSASALHGHCLEVAYATCGCNGGFSCPPASTTAVEGCKAVFTETAQAGRGNNVSYSFESTYSSESIGQGVHYVAFNVPLDIFNIDRTKMSISVKDGAQPPTIPAFNGAGDVLYIRDNSFDVSGKYKCTVKWLDSIDQHNMSVADMWEQRSTNGAKRGDVVQLKEVANCEAFANQPFTIVVTQRPENEVETNPSTPQ